MDGDQAPGFRQRYGWRPSTWVQTEVRMETKHLGSDRGTGGNQAPGFRQRYGWKASIEFKFAQRESAVS